MNKKTKRRLIAIAVAVTLLGGFLWYDNTRASETNTPQTSAVQGAQTTTEASPQQPPVPAFDKTEFSTTDPSSYWVVVNKKHPLTPKTYAPGDLTNVGSGQYLRAEAAKALTDMIAGAKAAGLTITPASGYRSYTTQVNVYNNEVKTNGQATADSQSARPGFSEHQTGLAMDLAGGGCSITDCFGTTAPGIWAAANAYKYGYILRYTQADTAVTGYRAEPWHFRYVGIPLATEMHESGVATLEVFFGVSGGASY